MRNSLTVTTCCPCPLGCQQSGTCALQQTPSLHAFIRVKQIVGPKMWFSSPSDSIWNLKCRRQLQLFKKKLPFCSPFSSCSTLQQSNQFWSGFCCPLFACEHTCPKGYEDHRSAPRTCILLQVDIRRIQLVGPKNKLSGVEVSIHQLFPIAKQNLSRPLTSIPNKQRHPGSGVLIFHMRSSDLEYTIENIQITSNNKSNMLQQKDTAMQKCLKNGSPYFAPKRKHLDQLSFRLQKTKHYAFPGSCY